MKNRSKFGILELIFGILLIILSFFTLSRPVQALTNFAFIYAIFAIITGVIDIIFYTKLEKRTGFGPTSALIGGILSIIVGIIMFIYPEVGTMTFAILFPIWFIAHCITRLTNLSFVKYIAGNGYYYFSLIINILGIVAGLLLVFNPYASIVSLGYIIGLYLLLFGIFSLGIGISKLGENF